MLTRRLRNVFKKPFSHRKISSTISTPLTYPMQAPQIQGSQIYSKGLPHRICSKTLSMVFSRAFFKIDHRYPRDPDTFETRSEISGSRHYQTYPGPEIRPCSYFPLDPRRFLPPSIINSLRPHLLSNISQHTTSQKALCPATSLL